MVHVWRAENNSEELILPNLAATGSFLFLPWWIVSAIWPVTFGAVSLFPSPISSWCGITNVCHSVWLFAWVLVIREAVRFARHVFSPSEPFSPFRGSSDLLFRYCVALFCFMSFRDKVSHSQWVTSRLRLWMISNASASWFLGNRTWVLRYARLAFYLLSYIASTTVLTVKHTDQQCWVHSWCSLTNLHNTWELAKTETLSTKPFSTPSLLTLATTILLSVFVSLISPGATCKVFFF